MLNLWHIIQVDENTSKLYVHILRHRGISKTSCLKNNRVSGASEKPRYLTKNKVAIFFAKKVH